MIVHALIGTRRDCLCTVNLCYRRWIDIPAIPPFPDCELRRGCHECLSSLGKALQDQERYVKQNLVFASEVGRQIGVRI
jgi:hypothetical protein